MEQDAYRFLQQDNGAPVPEWVYAVLFPEPLARHDAVQPGWWRRFYMDQTTKRREYLLSFRVGAPARRDGS